MASIDVPLTFLSIKHDTLLRIVEMMMAVIRRML